MFSVVSTWIHFGWNKDFSFPFFQKIWLLPKGGNSHIFWKNGKNGQYQTPETRPQLQTSMKKRSWTPLETMAMRRCRNRSNDLIHGGRCWWWWWWWWLPKGCWANFEMLWFLKYKMCSLNLFVKFFPLWPK